MKLDCSAVLDVGKTHVKLRVFDAQGQVIEQRDRPNHGVSSPQGYTALDTNGIEAWLWDSLASLTHRARISHLIVTTHGAAFAALDDDGLVLPMVDYEFDTYADQRKAYALAVGDLRETLSPHLPMGLNAARPWYWQAREFPEAFARAHTLLPYPQYWAWRLSGIAASEVSSLGCHTHLWSPANRSWSRLVRREGWARRFAPIRSAWDVLGPLRPELAQRLGLSRDCVVHTGVHDSNACLARYLRRWPAMTLVTSGTWTVVMACGGNTDALDLSSDMLANVSVAQDAVPTARFMGGRDHAALCAGAHPDDARASLVQTLSDESIRAVPTPDGPQVLHGDEDITTRLAAVLSAAERATLASLYCAQMTASRVQLLGAPSPLVVEGPLARNAVFVDGLSALLPGHECRVADDEVEGTARGAWELMHWNEAVT